MGSLLHRSDWMIMLSTWSPATRSGGPGPRVQKCPIHCLTAAPLDSWRTQLPLGKGQLVWEVHIWFCSHPLAFLTQGPSPPQHRWEQGGSYRKPFLETPVQR